MPTAPARGTRTPSGCGECPHMRPGSSFDGTHLYCEAARRWTNLLEGRFRGHCLMDGPDGQTALFGDEAAGADLRPSQGRGGQAPVYGR